MSASLPADGVTIRVQIPGQRRVYEWVVISRDGLYPDEAVIAGRPSRQWPGDWITVGRVLAEWIVPQDLTAATPESKVTP